MHLIAYNDYRIADSSIWCNKKPFALWSLRFAVFYHCSRLVWILFFAHWQSQRKQKLKFICRDQLFLNIVLFHVARVIMKHNEFIRFKKHANCDTRWMNEDLNSWRQPWVRSELFWQNKRAMDMYGIIVVQQCKNIWSTQFREFKNIVPILIQSLTFFYRLLLNARNSLAQRINFNIGLSINGNHAQIRINGSHMYECIHSLK